MAEVAAAFRGSGRRGLVRRADAIEGCAAHWLVAAPLKRPELSRAFPLHCWDRLCPVCSRSRGRRLAARLVPAMERARAAGFVPKFITLTQAVDETEGPRAARKRVRAAWARLWRRRAFRSRVRGWMLHCEETWSETRGADGRGRGWHAHLHIVADADFIPQGELADMWFAATGGRGLIVDIREAREGAERELLKYATKAASLAPAQVVTYATEMSGARDISTGGAWRGLTSDEDLEVDVPELPADAGDVARPSLRDVEARALTGELWAVEVCMAVERQRDEVRERWRARGRAGPRRPDTRRARAGPPRAGHARTTDGTRTEHAPTTHGNGWTTDGHVDKPGHVRT